MLDTDNMMDKISRVIIQSSKELSLRMHVKILREFEGRKENFHKVFAINGNKYLNLDIQAYLTLELKRDEWSIDKWIMINQNNIFHIIKGFKKLISAIYDKGIFAVTKDGNTVIYKDKVAEHTQKIYNLGNNNRIVVSPAIVYDENDITYEGVIIYINKTDNYVQLPIDAFESLTYTLEKIDIFVYSQELINYFVSTLKTQNIEVKQISSTKAKKDKAHPLSDSKQEEVKSTVTKKVKDEDFFDYPKKE